MPPLFTQRLPYILRLRQCVHEYFIPHQTSTRPLFNALKYASAFPVIFLSAAQRNVVKEIAKIKGVSVQALEEQMLDSTGRWFGESRTFRLWFLAVLVNSLFTFWWDVSNDWGLSLLQSSTWSTSPASTYSHRTTPETRVNIIYRNLQRLVASVAASVGYGQDSALNVGGAEDFELAPHRRSPFPSPPRNNGVTAFNNDGPDDPDAPTPMTTTMSTTATRPNHMHVSRDTLHTPKMESSHLPFSNLGPTGPFGLRPRLLFSRRFIYYLVIVVNLALRFTWSLKLSSHLHTISEIESGVFLMEALELLRRWIWVFLRIEWEQVKRIEAEHEAERQRMLRGNGHLGGGGGGAAAPPYPPPPNEQMNNGQHGLGFHDMER